MKHNFLALALAISLLVGGCAGAQNLPVPEDVMIVQPDSSVASDFAAFSGRWTGDWSGVLPSLLIVESVSASGQARGVYVWGSNSRNGVRPGALKFSAKIQNGMLGWGGNVKFEFTLTKDGILKGKSTDSGAGIVVSGDFKKTL